MLYCARHDFGTFVVQKTGNIAAVMNSLGALRREDGHDVPAPGIERRSQRDQFTAHFTAHRRNR